MTGPRTSISALILVASLYILLLPGRAQAAQRGSDPNLLPNPHVWAAHLEYQIEKSPDRLPMAPIVEFATKLYRSEPAFDTTTALQIMRKAEDGYKAKYGSSQLSDLEARSAVANLLIDVASGTPNLGTVAKNAGPLLQLPFQSMEAFEQGAAMDAAGVPKFVMTYDRPFPEYGRLSIFEQAATEAQSNKKLQAVLDAFVRGVGNQVSVTDSPWEIQQKSPDFGQNDRIKNALSVLDQTGKIRDIQVSHLRDDLKSTKAALLDNRKELTKLFNYLEHKDAHATSEEINRRIEREFGDATVSVYLMSSLVGLSDRKLGKQLATVGNAGTQIAKALAKKAAGTITMAALTGNIFDAASSVASLFFGGPSPEQLILDQIREVRNDITQLRAEMHDRFDRIEKALAIIQESLNTNFSSVFRELGYLRGDVLDVKEFLGQVSYDLNGLGSDVRTYQLDESRRPLIKLFDIAFRTKEGVSFSQERYEDYVLRFASLGDDVLRGIGGDRFLGGTSEAGSERRVRISNYPHTIANQTVAGQYRIARGNRPEARVRGVALEPSESDDMGRLR